MRNMTRHVLSCGLLILAGQAQAGTDEDADPFGEHISRSIGIRNTLGFSDDLTDDQVMQREEEATKHNLEFDDMSPLSEFDRVD